MEYYQPEEARIAKMLASQGYGAGGQIATYGYGSFIPLFGNVEMLNRLLSIERQIEFVLQRKSRGMLTGRKQWNILRSK